MTQELSLQAIMNDMASRLEVLRDDPRDKPKPKPLSELEAFLQIDELLGSLNKDYLEAKSQRKELAALHGADDAMTDVAIDMEDSAWCAMQGRYLELRGERRLMKRAQRLMLQADADVALEQKRDQEYEAKKLAHYMQTMKYAREQNKAPNYLEAFLVFMFLKPHALNQNFQPYRRNNIAA